MASRTRTQRTRTNPNVRLALGGNGRGTFEKNANPDGPHARLAHVDGAQGDGALQGRNGVKQLTAEQAPGLLISYFYLKSFLKNQHNYIYRDWVLDSGAFSAFNSGQEIDLEEFIDKSLELLAIDPTLSEVYSLDVIGDWRGSQRNTERMWAAGVPAIPCYHYGEPEEVLMEMAERYPKIAVGGMVGYSVGKRIAFSSEVFARVWPKRIHGFGMGSHRGILGLPFHSTDATTWEIRPCGFGQWHAFGTLNVRGSKQDLRKEVEYYRILEDKARHVWRKEMQVLAALPDESRAMIAALRSAGGGA
jgi:hypothetical protein